MRWSRGVGSAIVLAASALVASGCSNGNQLVQTSAPRPAAAVAGAAKRSLAAGTQHTSMRVTVDGDPIMTMDGAGTVDGSRYRGTVEMPGTMSVEYRMVDGTMYMKLSGSGVDMSGLTGGKSWLSLSLDDLGRAGVDLGAAAKEQQQGLNALDLLSQVGAEVVRVGEGRLDDGTPATHYRATIDVRKATTNGGVFSPSWGDEAARLLGDRTRMDVWIDHEGFARRIEYGVELGGTAVPGLPATGNLRYRFDFDRYGEPVDVQAPPASDVAGYDDLLGPMSGAFGGLGGLGGSGSSGSGSGSGSDGPN